MKHLKKYIKYEKIEENHSSCNYFGDKFEVSPYDDVFRLPLYFYVYKYMTGKIVYMTPDEFLEKLSWKDFPYEEQVKMLEDHSDHVNKLVNLMKSGEKFPIPYLICDVNGYCDHEGRHRSWAAKKLGCKKIPVGVFQRLTRKDVLNFVKEHGEKSFEEINDLFKNMGFNGITNLGYNDMKRFYKMNIDELRSDRFIKSFNEHKTNLDEFIYVGRKIEDMCTFITDFNTDVYLNKLINSDIESFKLEKMEKYLSYSFVEKNDDGYVKIDPIILLHKNGISELLGKEISGKEEDLKEHVKNILINKYQHYKTVFTKAEELYGGKPDYFLKIKSPETEKVIKKINNFKEDKLKESLFSFKKKDNTHYWLYVEHKMDKLISTIYFYNKTIGEVTPDNDYYYRKQFKEKKKYLTKFKFIVFDESGYAKLDPIIFFKKGGINQLLSKKIIKDPLIVNKLRIYLMETYQSEVQRGNDFLKLRLNIPETSDVLKKINDLNEGKIRDLFLTKSQRKEKEKIERKIKMIDVRRKIDELIDEIYYYNNDISLPISSEIRTKYLSNPQAINYYYFIVFNEFTKAQIDPILFFEKGGINGLLELNLPKDNWIIEEVKKYFIQKYNEEKNRFIGNETFVSFLKLKKNISKEDIKKTMRKINRD